MASELNYAYASTLAFAHFTILPVYLYYLVVNPDIAFTTMAVTYVIFNLFAGSFLSYTNYLSRGRRTKKLSPPKKAQKTKPIAPVSAESTTVKKSKPIAPGAIESATEVQ
jgi:uncharacterized MnhB-related membrane protein